MGEKQVGNSTGQTILFTLLTDQSPLRNRFCYSTNNLCDPTQIIPIRRWDLDRSYRENCAVPKGNRRWPCAGSVPSAGRLVFPIAKTHATIQIGWPGQLETSAKVRCLAFSTPAECHNPSRWLSPQRATPPEQSLKRKPIPEGIAQLRINVRPLPGRDVFNA